MDAETRWITVAYPDLADAQGAVQGLRLRGVAEQAISVLYTDARRITSGIRFGDEVWGGLLGGLVGLSFPPVGLLVVGGPVVDALTSGPGSTTIAKLDGVVAAMYRLGLPGDLAASLGERLLKGDVLLIAHPRDEPTARESRVVMESYSPRSDVSSGTGGAT